MDSLKRLIAWITRCRLHTWTTTLTNGWDGSPLQQRCDKCLQYRHKRLSSDKWINGEYPLRPKEIKINPRNMGKTAATTARWTKLTPEEFNETGLHESFRDHSYWNEDGYLVTVAMHKAAIDNLKPND
jgi:hypothetical protein